MARDCESCCYFGKASDAPESVPYDCMYVPSEDNDYNWTPPCMRDEDECRTD